MKKAVLAMLACICIFCLSSCEKSAVSPLAVDGNPYKIVVIIDNEGYQKEISFTDDEEISEFIELYDQVEIGEMVDIMVTDSYNSISFYYEDGSCNTLNINGSNLEKEVDGQTHYFELVNIKPLWSYINNHGTVAD